MSADYSAIEKVLKEMLSKAKTFDEKKSAIDTAIKLETLKLKARGGKWGHGFREGDDDDETN